LRRATPAGSQHAHRTFRGIAKGMRDERVESGFSQSHPKIIPPPTGMLDVCTPCIGGPKPSSNTGSKIAPTT
jgi:hypothetical protein